MASTPTSFGSTQTNGNNINGTLERNGDGYKKKWPTDKAYFLSKEILMTERTYKRDLDVINTVSFFKKVVKIFTIASLISFNSVFVRCSAQKMLKIFNHCLTISSPWFSIIQSFSGTWSIELLFGKVEVKKRIALVMSCLKTWSFFPSTRSMLRFTEKRFKGSMIFLPQMIVSNRFTKSSSKKRFVPLMNVVCRLLTRFRFRSAIFLSASSCLNRSIVCSTIKC